MAYKNVDYDKFNLEIVSGDTWNQTFTVIHNGVAYDMTGMQLDIEVKNADGSVAASASSGGLSPTIFIAGSSFNIYVAAPFNVTEKTKYEFDVQLTNGTTISTIARGYITAITQITD